MFEIDEILMSMLIMFNNAGFSLLLIDIVYVPENVTVLNKWHENK